jgi:DNA-binding transcriptional LysR family regulator
MEFRVRLFERDRRNVQLTAGNRFGATLERILSDLENATQRAREIQSGRYRESQFDGQRGSGSVGPTRDRSRDRARCK